MRLITWLTFTLWLVLGPGLARAEDAQLARGRQGILGRTGCFLVDYSYVETESLQAGYILDKRVYDVNKDKSVKEWIYADDLAPGHVHLQHVLFLAELVGGVVRESMLKHTGEDWRYGAPFLYDFTAPLHWGVKALAATPYLWSRRITNLDDGLRYACAAAWREDTVYPEWSCDNYAPIPGRETRDMRRHDYNTLQRSTRLVSYAGSWLERQANIKTIDKDGTRTPLAKELGKDWYVRLPDGECSDARAFAEAGRPFWAVLREAWESVLDGKGEFIEKAAPHGGASRYEQISDLEDKYRALDLQNPAVRQSARAEILRVISEFRQ